MHSIRSGALVAPFLFLVIAAGILWAGVGIARADSYDGGPEDFQSRFLGCGVNSTGGACVFPGDARKITYRVLATANYSLSYARFGVIGGDWPVIIKLYTLEYNALSGFWQRGSLLWTVNQTAECADDGTATETVRLINWDGGSPPAAGDYEMTIETTENTMVETACAGNARLRVSLTPMRIQGVVVYFTANSAEQSESDHDALKDSTWEVAEANQNFVPQYQAATPTMTATAAPPTNTPGPTATFTPVPTSTPLPTYTPQPTLQPFPTLPPGPTSQPIPTAVFQPTPIDYNGPLSHIGDQIGQVAWEIGHLPQRLMEALHWAIIPDGEALATISDTVGAAIDLQFPVIGQSRDLGEAIGAALDETPDCEGYEGLTITIPATAYTGSGTLVLFGPPFITWWCPYRQLVALMVMISGVGSAAWAIIALLGFWGVGGKVP